MIFGFSVGDFITAAQLATKIKRDFDKAPFQFKAISDEYVSKTVLQTLLTIMIK